MSVIASMLGGIAGLSVVLSRTPRPPVSSVPPDTFEYVRASPRSLCATDRNTFAGVLAKFATDALQCETPFEVGNVVGAHVCVSVTSPGLLLNAIGIVTAFEPCATGVSVMRPKY